jgi:predicted Zn finger-like uncharacterized protein
LKIACQSCQAKYTIADEKVVGKIVKIRCKKCGATIVINGNDPEATNPLPAGEGSSEWTVNVAEGDQRTMTSEEIIDGYRGGVVTDETFCWKDGMADWLPLREIDELYQAVSGGADASAQGGADFAPLSMRGAQEDQATIPLQREQMGGIFGGMGSGAAHAESNGNGASLFSGGAPAASPQSPPAARRVGGRAGGADLFGGAAAAGGEEDVMTSAPSGGSGGGNHSAANEEPGKLTGQRNENSVLFSLNALTSSGPKVEKEKPTADGSGLIDIRALSSTMANDTAKKKDHVDDIMNLGGGGAFNAPLAAPILAPPLAGPDVTDGGTPVPDKQKKMLIMIIAAFGGVILLMMIVVIYFVMKKPSVDDATAGGDRPALSGSAATPAGGTAPNDTSAAATSAAAVASAAPTATGGGALPPGTGAVAQNTAPTSHGGGGGHTTSHSSGGGGGGDSTPSTPPPSTGGGGGGGGGGGATDLFGAMNKAAGGGGGGGSAPATGGGGGTAPFDRGAAAAALGAISSALGSCKKGDGPTGSGHAQITFSPSGNVKSVDVDQPPFAGSSVGGCVAAKFRAAHVPAFSGGEVKVGKSFQIN